MHDVADELNLRLPAAGDRRTVARATVGGLAARCGVDQRGVELARGWVDRALDELGDPHTTAAGGAATASPGGDDGGAAGGGDDVIDISARIAGRVVRLTARRGDRTVGPLELEGGPS